MTLPSLLASDDPLAHAVEASRTERQLCSILQHLLLVRALGAGQQGNLERFLGLVNDALVESGESPLLDLHGFDPDQVDLLFEPAALRDYWHAFGPGTRKTIDITDANQRKREYLDELIRRLPNASQVVPALSTDPYKLNLLFGSSYGDQLPKHDVGQPGRWWHLEDLDGLCSPSDPLTDRAFRELCFLKWAFKIQPDLVFQFRNSGVPARPLCIEAKLESPPSTYPTGGRLCALYRSRCCANCKDGAVHYTHDYARQVDVQAFLFKVLIGRPAQGLVIASHSTAPGPVLTWKAIFAHMDTSSSVAFVARMLGGRGLPTRVPD